LDALESKCLAEECSALPLANKEREYVFDPFPFNSALVTPSVAYDVSRVVLDNKIFSTIDGSYLGTWSSSDEHHDPMPIILKSLQKPFKSYELRHLPYDLRLPDIQ
jgi:hypothetical protein